MDPVSLILVASALGTAVSAVGAIQQGKEQKRQYDFQARQQEIQAQEETYAGNVSATNARQGEKDAFVQWDDAQRQKDRVLGASRAAAAKSGLTISGSVLNVEEDTALTFQRESTAQLNSALNQAGNYRAESRGLFVSASNSRASAANSRKAGKAARNNSYWAAGGTVLSGIGQMASVSGGSMRAKSSWKPGTLGGTSRLTIRRRD